MGVTPSKNSPESFHKTGNSSEEEDEPPFRLFSASAQPQTADTAAACVSSTATSIKTNCHAHETFQLDGYSFMSRATKTACSKSVDGHQPLLIMTYNVLADAFVRKQFSYCPPERLNAKDRRTRIQIEIEHYKPDIVCMQEVEYDAFESVWLPFFEGRGWSGFIATEDKTGVGVATFYDKQRLEVRENEKVTLGTTVYKANTSEHDIGNWTPFGRLTGRKTKKKRARIHSYLKDFDQYAKPMLITLFDVKSGDGEGDLKFPLLVGNVHLYWDPSVPDFKVLQAYFANIHMSVMMAKWFPWTAESIRSICPYSSEVSSSVENNHESSYNVKCLSEEQLKAVLPDKTTDATVDIDETEVVDRPLDRDCSKLPATVLCGDFNSLPYLEQRPEDSRASGVYDMLTHGYLLDKHPHHPVERNPEKIPKKSIPHLALPFKWRSAYAAVEGEEPPWTNKQSSFEGTLDYIFYTGKVEPLWTLSLPSLSGACTQKPLPSGEAPSDHLPLLSAVVLK